MATISLFFFKKLSFFRNYGIGKVLIDLLLGYIVLNGLN